MLRGVAARCIGVATAGAAVASAPTGGAFCHASSPAINPREKLSSSLNLSQKEVSSASDSPSKPLVILTNDEAEDWEYCAQEEWTERPLGHLVFAPAPTEQEVEEATKDLHDALHLSIPLSGSSLEGSSEEPSLGVLGSLSQNGDTGMVLTVRDKQEVGVKFSQSHMGLAAGSSSVYEAFHLLRSNPQVQGAVKSLACDPAVWEAVLNNEKVKELTQSLQNIDDTCSCKEQLPARGLHDEINFCLNFASKVWVHVTAKVLQLMDKIVEIVGSIFGSVEKTLPKKGISAIDKTVASCVMLAVAVLLVVVIKRGSPK